ncbi:MAG: ERF family protein [Alphaproteobacteria bacterium]|nr:ERF family protein [Alphaproteobacteria bacterium]
MATAKTERTPQQALYAALVAAQAEIKNVEPNQENTYHGSKYADLSAVLDAVRPVFTAKGLAIAQVLQVDQHGAEFLRTIVMHEDGGTLESDYRLPPYKRTQERGSDITYARRYSLSAIAGISAEEDDDGNKGQDTRRDAAPKSQRGDPVQSPPPPAAPRAMPPGAPTGGASQQPPPPPATYTYRDLQGGQQVVVGPAQFLHALQTGLSVADPRDRQMLRDHNSAEIQRLFSGLSEEAASRFSETMNNIRALIAEGAPAQTGG